MTTDAHRYRLTIAGTSALGTRQVEAFVKGRDGWEHHNTYTHTRGRQAGTTTMFVSVTARLSPEDVATIIGLELPNQSISVGILEPVNLAEERDRAAITKAHRDQFIRGIATRERAESRPA